MFEMDNNTFALFLRFEITKKIKTTEDKAE